MKRILRALCACLLAAVWACSLFEPDDPGYGSLTGDWEAWCCPKILDSGAELHLSIVEEPIRHLAGTGHIAGVVVMTSYSSLPIPPVTWVDTGTVAGTHKGSEVVLVFTYENGNRHRSEGKQTSETTFLGQMDGGSWHGVTLEFVRVSDPS